MGRLLRVLGTGRPFKVLVSILGAIAVTITIILGVRQLIPDPEPARYSVLMIVDTSSSMTEKFGKRTKFASVRNQILRFARRSPSTAIAIRFTGGICSDEYDPPAVAFSEDNESALAATLTDQTTSTARVTDFASAVIEGVDDFRQSEVARDSPSQSIWAFLGAATDGCTKNATNEVKLALEGFSRKAVKFNFFGVGASEREKKRLDAVLTKLRDAGYEAYARAPQDVSELRKSVENTALRETPSE